jgi:hypothetical protein
MRTKRPHASHAGNPNPPVRGNPFRTPTDEELDHDIGELQDVEEDTDEQDAPPPPKKIKKKSP